jgi:hypothetical protein
VVLALYPTVLVQICHPELSVYPLALINQIYPRTAERTTAYMGQHPTALGEP